VLRTNAPFPLLFICTSDLELGAEMLEQSNWNMEQSSHILNSIHRHPAVFSRSSLEDRGALPIGLRHRAVRIASTDRSKSQITPTRWSAGCS
jgi:hypothetical protein